MFFMSDSWLGLGVVVMIGAVVVGLATCMGKLIIWIFGTGHEETVTSGEGRETMKSELHRAM
jgi:hypothetical protein